MNRGPGDNGTSRRDDARLGDAWLPENGFAWEPTDHVDPPEVAAASDDDDADEGRFVRRLLRRPEPLSSDDDGRPRLDPPLRGAPRL